MEASIDGFFSAIINAIITFLEAILGFLLQSTLSTLITGFVFMNGLGYLLMYLDKKVAKNNGKIKEEHKDLEEKELKKLLNRRTPESTFMLIAILFGSLGILAGMYKFNHKTQKPKFKYGVPIIIGLQVIFVIWRIINAVTTQTPA
jgi:uncharacterized membrane protein YsdA (DUF1294 family)